MFSSSNWLRTGRTGTNVRIALGGGGGGGAIFGLVKAVIPLPSYPLFSKTAAVLVSTGLQSRSIHTLQYNHVTTVLDKQNTLRVVSLDQCIIGPLGMQHSRISCLPVLLLIDFYTCCSRIFWKEHRTA